jgi:hypothetical protein
MCNAKQRGMRMTGKVIKGKEEGEEGEDGGLNGVKRW